VSSCQLLLIPFTSGAAGYAGAPCSAGSCDQYKSMQCAPGAFELAGQHWQCAANVQQQQLRIGRLLSMLSVLRCCQQPAAIYLGQVPGDGWQYNHCWVCELPVQACIPSSCAGTVLSEEFVEKARETSLPPLIVVMTTLAYELCTQYYLVSYTYAKAGQHVRICVGYWYAAV
jgi:hypothetical protein